MMRRKLQRGLGLFEVIVAACVVSVILTAGAYWWTSASRKIRIEKTFDQIIDVVSTVQQTWGSRGSYTGLTEAVLIGSGVLDQKIHSGGQIKFEVTKDPGDNVTIEGRNLGAGVGCNGRASCMNIIGLNLYGLDNYECQELSRRDYGANHYEMGIGPVGGPMTWNLTRTDVGAINAICNQGAASGYRLSLGFM